MKILFVCSGNSSLGVSPIIRAQIDSLKKAGIDPELYPISKPGISGYFLSVNGLRRKIRQFKPDIIHAHYGISGIVSLLTFTGRTTIISFMGDDLLGSVGRNSRYTLFSRMLVMINIFLARYYYSFCIVKSNELEKKISKCSDKIVIPNGVNLEVFKPADRNSCRKILNIPVHEKIVLFVSDPARPEKNYSLAKKALESDSDDNTRLIAVYSEEQSRLIYYYNAADLLLLTSLHEGSPNVVKEAMACGCPVVSTNVGDVASIIEGVEGCFLTDFNPVNISADINKAVSFRRQAGFTRGRDKIIRAGLDSDTVATRLKQVYFSAIN